MMENESGFVGLFRVWGLIKCPSDSLKFEDEEEEGTRREKTEALFHRVTSIRDKVCLVKASQYHSSYLKCNFMLQGECFSFRRKNTSKPCQ